MVMSRKNDENHTEQNVGVSGAGTAYRHTERSYVPS
jgi:hypothetical protein